MSIHPSLKTKSGALNQHRNVLTRAERVSRLTLEGRFDAEQKSVLGIVKVRSIKATVSKKPKKEAAAGAEGEGAAAAAGAKPAAGAAGAKSAAASSAGAKPAAGAAKAAAPAGKK